MTEQNHWNERYSAPGYRFGKAPADFLRRESGRIAKASSVLCVADGEGRNSVYLASLGHQVTAFDQSERGVEKARALAEEAGQAPGFHVAGVEEWDWTRTHDVVVAIFIQFAPPELRDRILAWLGQAVAPGGLLLLHGYVPRQLEYGTGGPPDAANMYTTDLLERMYDGFDILHLAEYDAHVDEGPGHSGLSALIDLVARKPGITPRIKPGITPGAGS